MRKAKILNIFRVIKISFKKNITNKYCFCILLIVLFVNRFIDLLNAYN